jgi:hypothetical protein
VYLGIPAILGSQQASDLPVHSGMWTRNPINCGTQALPASGNGEEAA